MMSILDADSMHRLAKLSLDAGEVASPEEAVERFSRYRLRIHLGRGWADTKAGQACFLTALNTAARAFLGGVEVSGELEPVLTVPLYEGRATGEVIKELGGTTSPSQMMGLPTLVLGDALDGHLPEFCIQPSWDHWQANITPAGSHGKLVCIGDNPLSGVAAAALAVNEAFLFVRGDLPEAGHRTVGLSLWNPLAIDDWESEANKGPKLNYLPKDLWLIGLGHLGQAYAWTLALLPYPPDARANLVLQDFDKAAESNLSTCMLLASNDLGKTKVRLVARQLEAAGFTTHLVERRFGPRHELMLGEPATALFGVDNVVSRRDIDTAGFAMTVEAGLGSGYRDFRNIRTHTFPGPRKASEIWSAESVSQAAIKLNETYKKLAAERNDLCGMTQLASRAVATPFVGAMAAALVLAEVLRPLHGGGTHSVLDLQLKNLRHRTGAGPTTLTDVIPSFVELRDS
jgi:hypothetical protein